MEITAKVYKVGATETVGAKGFEKRLLVVETDEQYSQKIPIEFVQGNVNKLDAIKEGQQVVVTFDLQGKEYQDKFYLSARGYKIEAKDSF